MSSNKDRISFHMLSMYFMHLTCMCICSRRIHSTCYRTKTIVCISCILHVCVYAQGESTQRAIGQKQYHCSFICLYVRLCMHGYTMENLLVLQQDKRNSVAYKRFPGTEIICNMSPRRFIMPSHQRWHTSFSKCNEEYHLSLIMHAWWYSRKAQGRIAPGPWLPISWQSDHWLCSGSSTHAEPWLQPLVFPHSFLGVRLCAPVRVDMSLSSRGSHEFATTQWWAWRKENIYETKWGEESLL
jgi:hypothetical protein